MALDLEQPRQLRNAFAVSALLCSLLTGGTYVMSQFLGGSALGTLCEALLATTAVLALCTLGAAVRVECLRNKLQKALNE